MKAKLIKKDDNYFLEVEYWYPKYIQSSIIANTFVKPKGDVYDLSKQNCDEIFGIVDIEKLAEEYARTAHDIIDEPYQNGLFYGFMTGSKKTMELNKDKMFTLEDIYDAVMLGVCFEDSGIEGISTYEELKELAVKRASKPTEIEVMVEMECKIGCEHLVLNGKNSLCCGNKVPKLDSEGYLILKKI
jgi:hypothetical protein